MKGSALPVIGWLQRPADEDGPARTPHCISRARPALPGINHMAISSFSFADVPVTATACATATATARQAMVATAQQEPEYWASCLRTRTQGSPDRAGSFFPVGTTGEVADLLAGAVWAPYEHPDIKTPAVGFRAEVPGMNGMVALSALPLELEVTLLDPKGGAAHWDGRQKVGATIPEGEGRMPTPVEFTVLLVGPGPDGLQAWTFHPGDPCAPSMVDRTVEGVDRHGTRVTVAEAMALGLTHAKLTAQ